MATPMQNYKLAEVIRPAAIVDNSAFTTIEIDTLGFHYAQVVVYIGATDIAFTVCKMQESETSGSGFADVTGLISATSTDTEGNTSALPTATDDNKFYVFDIDLRGRMRYLDLNLTIGNGTVGGFAVAWCNLFRGDEGINTAAERGALEVLRV